MKNHEPADFALPLFGIALAAIFALPVILTVLEAATK